MTTRKKPDAEDLFEGQSWDEVGSAVVNARTRTINTIGSKLLTYTDECGRQKTLKIKSFLRWARTFAESTQRRKP